MRYMPSVNPINRANSASFLNIYQLAIISEQQAMVVRQIAESEPPPKATNRASVQENCQGWIVRVITKLVEKGIVPATIDNGETYYVRSHLQALSLPNLSQVVLAGFVSTSRSIAYM